jgi:ubiquinone/menaquinone biosynthesis C-methylase UbiE
MHDDEMKQREFNSWSSVAAGWRKHDESLRRNTAEVTARMLDLARLGTGHKLLDLACGTGEPAIPAARRVGPTGYVAASDLVEEMVMFAREKALAQGLSNIEFRVADAEHLPLNPGSVDAVTIRWGMMFMPGPLAALSNAHRALKPGGCIVVANWAGPDKNPWASVALSVMKRHVDIPPPAPGATGLYSFADPERCSAMLVQAGFRDVAVESLEVPVIDVADGTEYFTWVREMAGPIASIYARLPADQQTLVAGEVAAEAQAQSQRRGKVKLSGVTWIASAMR